MTMLKVLGIIGFVLFYWRLFRVTALREEDWKKRFNLEYDYFIEDEKLEAK